MLKKNKLTGERIRKIRKGKGMTQEELALAVGYSGKGAIARIESGDNGASLEKLIAIAKALDVAPDYLTGASEYAYTAQSGRPAAKELIARISNPDCYTQLSDFELEQLTYFLNNPELICVDHNGLLIEMLSDKVISENGKEAVIRYGNPHMKGNECEYSVYFPDDPEQPIIIFKCYLNHYQPTFMLKWFKVVDGQSFGIEKAVMHELIKTASLFRMTKFYVGDVIINDTKISPDDEDRTNGVKFFDSFDYGSMKLELNK